jgi:hypothetical protein
VAVGAPITGGTLRVIDANGTVAASGIIVAADGSYEVPTLTGTAPYRIEACGYAGPNYQCIYSVTQGTGRANVTPLTTATVLLASGQAPEALMAGANATLTPSAVNTAQTQLRTSLASVLTGNVSGSFDFVGGDLAAGSRTGYDKVLDAIGVSTGVDTQPFVQITPRQGTGNLYLEVGATPVGTLTQNSQAANMSLGGVETLFSKMTTAIQSATVCNNATTGLRPLLSADAMLSMGEGDPITGAVAVAEGLCQFLGGEDNDSGGPMWGSTFLSPTLGRCDFGGAAPVCRVSFVIRDPAGNVQPVGQGMAVGFEGGEWRFRGDASPISIHASARVQRDQALLAGQVTTSYSRALAFDIPALTGLQCAKVSQPDTNGGVTTVAYYKRYDGEGAIRRLSVWRDNNSGDSRGMDPLHGFARSSDDTWLMLPSGVEGDGVVRNFFRAGRTVQVSLYSDDACSTALNVAGQSQFDVDVEGVPPLWANLPSLAWPELTSTTKTNLGSFTLATAASADFNVAWGFTGGRVGVNGITFCVDRAECGQDQPGRIGERNVSPAVSSGVVPVTNNNPPITAGHYKMIALYGSGPEGVGLQSNYIICATGTVGECH